MGVGTFGKKIQVWIDGKHVHDTPVENIDNVRHHYMLRGLERNLRFVDPEKQAEAERSREEILARLGNKKQPAPISESPKVDEKLTATINEMVEEHKKKTTRKKDAVN